MVNNLNTPIKICQKNSNFGFIRINKIGTYLYRVIFQTFKFVYFLMKLKYHNLSSKFTKFSFLT